MVKRCWKAQRKKTICIQTNKNKNYGRKIISSEIADARRKYRTYLKCSETNKAK
jgi:hypothetical protein